MKHVLGKRTEPLSKRDVVNTRVGCNFYGRIDAIRYLVETNRDASARKELLALLKFFPATSKDKPHR